MTRSNFVQIWDRYEQFRFKIRCLVIFLNLVLMFSLILYTRQSGQNFKLLLLLFTKLLTLFVLPKQIAVNTIYFFPTLRSFECLISWTFHFFISHLSIFLAMCGSISNLLVKLGSCYHSVWSWFYLKSQFLVLVVVIGMLGVQLQINHESLPKEGIILSKCKAQGQNHSIIAIQCHC